MDFNTIWERILSHQGETFYTTTGLSFIYEVYGDVLRTNRTKYNLSKINFIKAYAMRPLSGPGDISKDVRGPSYVYAILSDKRIAG